MRREPEEGGEWQEVRSERRVLTEVEQDLHACLPACPPAWLPACCLAASCLPGVILLWLPPGKL